MKSFALFFLLFGPISVHAAASASNPINYLLGSEPLSLDPSVAEDDYALNILSNTMDGLTGYDENGKLENRLAESVKISDGGKRYLFTLRKNIKWSDGKAVRPSDFVDAIRRALDPKTGSKIVSQFYVIRGAREFQQGKAQATQVGVSEKDGKLEFQLEKPTSYFLHLLSLSQAYPTRKEILALNGGKWPETGPVTGAYHLVSHTRNQQIKLEVNREYWKDQSGALDVVLKIVGEESSALALFESGHLDISSKIPVPELARMRKLGRVFEFPHAATYFLSFNARVPPFDQALNRRAVSGAIDRTGLIAALNLPFIKAESWVPPGLEGHQDSMNLDSQPLPDSALEKIKAAKFEVGASFNSNDLNRIIMERVQNDLQKKLKMKVSLNSMDWGSYVSEVRTRTPSIFRYQRGAPFLDPIWHLASFKGTDPNNFTGWKNSEYDHLVDEVSTTPSGKKREQLIKEAEKILVKDEAIVVPLYFVKSSFLVSPQISGFHPNPLSVVLFRNLRKKE